LGGLGQYYRPVMETMAWFENRKVVAWFIV
jgi:hypothetical protein